MTWDEFKAKVDRYLKEQGIDGTIPLGYVDLSGYDPDHVTIYVDKDGALVVVWTSLPGPEGYA